MVQAHMVIEGNSDIIIRCEYITDNQTGPCQWLTFRNGFILVMNATFMALYKNNEAIGDPLGNGLKAMVDIPDTATLQKNDHGFVAQFSAGFVGLIDDKALLITPNDIQLFFNKTDALHNKNEIVRLALS